MVKGALNNRLSERGAEEWRRRNHMIWKARGRSHDPGRGLGPVTGD
jgi:hypothetical protein